MTSPDHIIVVYSIYYRLIYLCNTLSLRARLIKHLYQDWNPSVAWLWNYACTIKITCKTYHLHYLQADSYKSLSVVLPTVHVFFNVICDLSRYLPQISAGELKCSEWWNAIMRPSPWIRLTRKNSRNQEQVSMCALGGKLRDHFIWLGDHRAQEKRALHAEASAAQWQKACFAFVALSA